MRSPLALTALALLASFTTTAWAEAPGTRLWTGRLPAPRNLPLHEAARAVLRLTAPNASRAELIPAGDATTSDGERFVSFVERHLGRPVLGGGATVRFAASGDAVLVTDRTVHTLPHSATPRVSVEEAAQAATRSTRLVASAGKTTLAFRLVDAGEARLVYAVPLAPRFPEAIAPRALVDAETGEVLEVRDLAVRVKAKTYESNPLKSTLALREVAVSPTGGKLSSEVLESSSCVDDKTVRSVDLGLGSPTSVHVCSLTQRAVPNESGDFVYEPTDSAADPARDSDEFSEVAMYYHAAKAYAFFRSLRGEPEAQVVLDRPLRTVSNLRVPAGVSRGDLSRIGDPEIPLEPFQNAFFSPGGDGDLFSTLYGFTGGSMWFGQGPRHDYSYDGDVVYHEFTHAVVHATLELESWARDTQGAVAAPGAMNEGLADYFSSVIAGDPDVGEYASKDVDPGLLVIRTLANTDACPGELGGEVHSDSTFWSGALWTARQALAAANRSVFDRAIYKAMLANPGRGSVTFEEMNELILAVLATDLPAGKAALEAALQARGGFPSCERVRKFVGTPLRGPAGVSNSFVAPGRRSHTSFRPLAPGVMTFAFDVPARTKQVAFSFATGSGQGGSPFGGGTPFTPVVFARFDEKLVWTRANGNLSLDGAISATTTKAGTTTTATFDAPVDAKVMYVQIANSGQSDGAYSNVVFTTKADETPTPASEPGAEVARDREAARSGCACAVTGARTSSPMAPLGLLVAGAAVASRSRRRRG